MSVEEDLNQLNYTCTLYVRLKDSFKVHVNLQGIALA